MGGGGSRFVSRIRSECEHAERSVSSRAYMAAIKGPLVRSRTLSSQGELRSAENIVGGSLSSVRLQVRCGCPG